MPVPWPSRIVGKWARDGRFPRGRVVHEWESEARSLGAKERLGDSSLGSSWRVSSTAGRWVDELTGHGLVRQREVGSWDAVPPVKTGFEMESRVLEPQESRLLDGTWEAVHHKRAGCFAMIRAEADLA